ncbi:MAG: SDR family NAD(P)-dependent oxidoreductase [Acuticoccus sp.]
MKLDQTVAAVVTGGASGLGAATARKLAAAGAKVAIFDMSEEAGTAMAREIGGVFAAVDVTSEDSLADGFASARAAHGPERILVNCAGIAPVGKTVSRGAAHPFDMFAKVIDVNLVGTFRAAALSALSMSGLDPVSEDGERGVIVNTASVAAYDGQIGQAAYAASKAGVAGLTLPLARDLSQYGIRVMTIAPGIFETPMLIGLGEKVINSLGQQVPFPKRLGRPDEYADLAMAIIGNGLLNGEVIRLDGAIRMAPR